MIQRSMWLGGAALWLTACGAPAVGQAWLETEQDTYAPGAEIELRLSNKSFQYLGYNLCASRAQRHEEDGTWTDVKFPGAYCTAHLAHMPPGASETYRNTHSRELEVGEYRYVTRVDWSGEREEVVSNPFRIQ